MIGSYDEYEAWHAGRSEEELRRQADIDRAEEEHQMASSGPNEGVPITDESLPF